MLFVQKFRKQFREILIYTAAFGIGWKFNQYLFFSYCLGPSMLPTLENKDIILVNGFSYLFNNPQKNDVIITKSSVDTEKNICKRIIHIPGEEVSINGRKILLQENQYWIEGDNKDNSYDSRFFGPIHQSLIKGKVTYIMNKYHNLNEQSIFQLVNNISILKKQFFFINRQ